VSAGGLTLFDTAIGRCGVAWSRRGITALQLPERDDAATRARLERRSGGIENPPPPRVQDAIAGVTALLRGDLVDLTGIVLDLGGVADFDLRVLAIARTIPPGHTMTYGQIARRMGEPEAARAVGAALGRNPVPIIVPCHRVLGADGKPGGFSAPGGVQTKARLLSIERATTTDAPMLFDDLPVAVRPRPRNDAPRTSR
jgi:methylated-DNA-[protein]-cysteine S-methyltransferase